MRPRLTLEDVEWGYANVQLSIDYIEQGFEEYMAGSPFQELCKAILRALRSSKDVGLKHFVILPKKGIGIHDQRIVKSAYDRLVEMGEIERPQCVNGDLRIRLKEAAL